MKLWSKITTAVAGVAILALGLTASGASAPIQNSKHNMNNVFGPNTIQNNEICLPCHAPHNRQPEGTDLEYLWNHEMPTTEYTLYGSGSKYVGLDEASKMCLSCHDGTVAVDSYYSTMGATTPGGVLHEGTHTLGKQNDLNGNSTAGFVIGSNGDLSHDHPVGVVYPGLTTGGTWTSTRGFKDPTKFSTSQYIAADQTGAPTGGYNYSKYVSSTGGTITAVGGASISLQKQNATDTVGTVVGCVACHTPHTNTYNFLHVPNVNSQLCLTCHDK